MVESRVIEADQGVVTGLPDVAMEFDPRGIRLPSVGIRGFRLPLQLINGDGEEQTVLAEADVGVAIDAYQRGTHMSRLVEALYRWAANPCSRQSLGDLVRRIEKQLQTDEVRLVIRFDYFLRQHAPVTDAFGLVDVNVEWETLLQKDTLHSRTYLNFPAMTLCPCSKAIADYGAHNQRAYVRLWLETQDRLPLLPERFLAAINETASIGVYAVLKREDEKHVTERAYENPRFVEDVVRELALRLREENDLTWFRIDCESVESIHNHNAFASYEETKRQ